jgi:hypothetical protein
VAGRKLRYDPVRMTETARRFGHYEVEKILGRGAMGTVYLARDVRIGRRVALKTVKVDARFDDDAEAAEFYQRLQREAELGGSLQHPNIVTLYEPGYENDRIAWLATEYVEGESLRETLKREQRLPLDDALRIAEDLLRGLSYAHVHGVIHRDIKPANILIARNGDAKIADFGIARASDSTLTSVGAMLGTPSYMSPEQVRCKPVTPRTDLFSFGAMLYEMLTGLKAFGAPDIGGILRNVVEQMPPPPGSVNPEIPAAVDEIVMTLLAKHPGDRFDSADAALQALSSARRGTPPPKPPPAEEIETIASGPPVNAAAPETVVTAAPASLLRRQVPVWAASLVFLLFLGVLGIAYLALRAQLESAPFDVTETERQIELVQKRQLLERARSLSAAGNYAAAVDVYEAIINEHPESAVARAERDRAQAQLGESTRRTEQRAETKKKEPPPKEKPKRPSFRDRLRRIFGRG